VTAVGVQFSNSDTESSSDKFNFNGDGAGIEVEAKAEVGAGEHEEAMAPKVREAETASFPFLDWDEACVWPDAGADRWVCCSWSSCCSYSFRREAASMACGGAHVSSRLIARLTSQGRGLRLWMRGFSDT
jgi:hypothetical protein